ncbi:MAG: regulatory iron-sulfur-containing complex subunit RicT [Dehalococcoidia bacterium]
MPDTPDPLVGIRFIEAGPVSYCRPGELLLGVGDYVVVRTDRGERLGWVVIAPDQVLASEHRGPWRVIDRLATEADIEAWRENRDRAREDLGRAQALATRSDPRIRVASLEYDLAREHASLTFAASERVDYDWLRRQSGELLECDVEVDQVGDRDRAKAAGGLGVCGRALCCATWQTEFPAISIKMAKDQDLAPNPTKISGVCGRLLCCLSFEVEQYRELRGGLPKVGKNVTTPIGRARVLSINLLRGVARLRFESSGEIVEMSTDELRGQFGTAVRPAELEAQIEAPIRRRQAQLDDNLVAVLEPVGAATERSNDRSERSGPSDDGTDADGQPRRRRRGRRGGRRRRRGGEGAEGQGTDGSSGGNGSNGASD